MPRQDSECSASCSCQMNRVRMRKEADTSREPDSCATARGAGEWLSATLSRACGPDPRRRYQSELCKVHECGVPKHASDGKKVSHGADRKNREETVICWCWPLMQQTRVVRRTLALLASFPFLRVNSPDAQITLNIKRHSVGLPGARSTRTGRRMKCPPLR